MASLRLDGVSKTYGRDVRAVDRVDLHVSDGEFIVLVGPSGCGKSTTLRMIAGLEDLSGGTIHIGDRIVNEIAPKDRDIAMVFQNYALYPHLTVRQNLSFGLERRRLAKGRLRALWDSDHRNRRREESNAIRARVESAASTLGISALLERAPRELSGGQRQRVAVGRALVRNPAVFLFDEPLSNLDALMRGEMRTELRILHRKLRATMIYVTHDQEEAMSLADRIVVMKDGIVQQIGSPSEIYQHPVNRFVAGFIGTPPMNMIEGCLVSSDGKFTFRSACAAIDLPPTRWDPTQLAASASAVTLGIRPDRLTVGSGEPAPTDINATIVALERYGSTADIIAQANGSRITTRCTSDTTDSLREGQNIRLRVDPATIHLFAADGRSINCPQIKCPSR